MKLLAIYVSPRIRGNSTILMDKFIEAASTGKFTIDRLYLNQLKIKPCQAWCFPEPGFWCRFDDGMTIVYEKVLSAEAIVVSSPIYFGSLPGQIKVMIDRFQCYWLVREKKQIPAKAEKRKPAFFLCVEASHRQDFFQNAKAIIKNFLATTGFTYTGEVFCPGVEKEGDINNHRDYLQAAYQAGIRLVNFFSVSK